MKLRWRLRKCNRPFRNKVEATRKAASHRVLALPSKACHTQMHSNATALFRRPLHQRDAFESMKFKSKMLCSSSHMEVSWLPKWRHKDNQLPAGMVVALANKMRLRGLRLGLIEEGPFQRRNASNRS